MNKEKNQKEKLKNWLESLKPQSPARRGLIEKYEPKIFKWFAMWHKFLRDVELTIFYGSYLFKW